MSQRLLKMTVNLCRIIVALTFIFSGFVKAIDPIGLQYKLQDYLGAVGMPGILPEWLLLIIAVLLAAVEFCMGIFLLFAIQRRLISKLIVVFMSIMTLITVWLVVANPVKDWGCFAFDKHRNTREEHHPSGLFNRHHAKTFGDVPLHFRKQPVDSHQLYDCVYLCLQRSEPLLSATV